MRSEPRVIHIVPSEPWGGIQSLVPMLAQEQARQGLDVKILCLGRGVRIRQAAAAAGLAGRTRSLSGILAPFALFAALFGRRAILHSHCEPIWAGCVIAATLSRRWIAHVHVYPNYHLTWKMRLSFALHRYLAARHIAISQSIGRALLACGMVTEAKLDVVPNGLPIASDRAKRPTLQPGFTVGFVGRAVAVKGLYDFVELARLMADEPDLAFAVYGDGVDLAAARALAAKHGLAERIVFHGYVEDMDAAWGTIDAAAVFSDREPFGLVFLEAALHGAATVSYDNDSGGSEVAATLRSAHRVAPRDLAAAATVLRALAADRATTATALAEDRVTIAERYDIATMARGVAESYARLERAAS